VAKPNYRQAKKQKEASRKLKQAERLERRTARSAAPQQPEPAVTTTPDTKHET
jgi:hypothetical protein